MNQKQKDGGPAFPIELPQGCQARKDMSEGMSLRDWFAGMALHTIANQSLDHDAAAEDAYNFADAMLKARQS